MEDRKSKILIEALPYIKKYSGKVIVIKIGGKAIYDDNVRLSIMEDIVLLNTLKIKTVVVHGGGVEISELSNKYKLKEKYIDSIRVTDLKTLEITKMVLTGKINTQFVLDTNKLGGRAVGLSGVSSNMVVASIKDDKLGYVGKVDKVNSELLINLLDNEYIPIISPIATSISGDSFYVDDDIFASAIASSLLAESFISLIDEDGIMKDKNDPKSLIPLIHASDARELIKDGIIEGKNFVKVNACIEAIRRGVKQSFLISGTKKHSILLEVLTNEGVGTMFVAH